MLVQLPTFVNPPLSFFKIFLENKYCNVPITGLQIPLHLNVLHQIIHKHRKVNLINSLNFAGKNLSTCQNFFKKPWHLNNIFL